MAAPRPVRGHGLTGGWGEESTWGTEVARSNWMPLNSQSVARRRVKQVIPHQGYLGQASNNPREFFVDEDRVEGSFEVCMAYDDSTLLLLKHLMGSLATGAGPPYTHTFTLADQPEGLSMEIIPGTSSDFSAAQQFTGCMISRGTITIRPGSPLLLACDIVGRTSGGLEAAGTPTYNTTRERILQNHCTSLQLGGTDVALKQMIIRVDRALEPLRELKSLHPSRPVPGQLSVEIELLAAWQANTFHTRYYADTQGDLVAAFTGATSPNAMTLTAHNCLIMDTSEPVSAAGQIEQRILLKPFADTSNQGLAIAIVNDNSSGIAN